LKEENAAEADDDDDDEEKVGKPAEEYPSPRSSSKDALEDDADSKNGCLLLLPSPNE
jgi:hypothetical protein